MTEKFFKNNKGFSLAELLTVVALLGILFSIAAVNIVSYNKKINQLQYDSYAKTIYTAAQNRLTELYAANGSKSFDGVELDPVGDSGLKSISSDDGEVVRQILFPENSIDTELIAHSWKVEFRPENGFVYAAFYSNKVGASDFDDEMRIKTDGLRANGIVGYYGYENYEDDKDYSKLRDYKCKLNIVNKDILKAHVDISAPESYSGDVILHMTVASEAFPEHNSGDISIKIESDGTDSYSYDLILDSFINRADSTKAASDFSTLYSGFGIAPGEDIKVIAYVEYKDADNAENTPPVTAVTNSLFAAYNSETSTATVRYARHLQNLNKTVSKLAVNVTNVTQDRSIDFTDTGADMWAGVYGTTAISSEDWFTNHAYLPFAPITNDDILTFKSVNKTGSGCTITGLLVNETGSGADGGLFASFKGNELTGINLVGAYINASGDAGTLAGKLLSSSVAVNNCSSYLLYSDYNGQLASKMQWVKAGGNAGGLFGSVVSVNMVGCSASSVIYTESGYAGGLFGKASGTADVENSYADCYIFGNSLGGLGGSAVSADIDTCYSAGFLLNPDDGDSHTAETASGYIPGFTATHSYSIFDYSTGKASHPEPVDSAGVNNVNENFVKYNADNVELTKNLTTAYNIFEGEEGLSAYEFPMLKKPGRTGNSEEDIMHHYGDWNGATTTTYTVTWKNDNPAAPLEPHTSKVLKDEVPVFPGKADELKQYMTDKYIYTFDHWSPTIVPATADITYTAVYNEEIRTFTVTYHADTTEDSDHIQEFIIDDVEYGTKLYLVDSPSANDFGEDIFELDGKLYTQSSYSSQYRSDYEVVSDTDVYVKLCGYILHSDAWSEDKKFGPNIDQIALPTEGDNAYAMPTGTISDGYQLDAWCTKSKKEILSKYGVAITAESGYTAQKKESSESADTSYVYVLKPDGVKDLYAKWVHYGDKYELTDRLVSGTYVIANSPKGSGESSGGKAAKCLSMGASSTSVVTSSCKIYSNSNTKKYIKKSEVPVECIWDVTATYNGYRIRNAATGRYLAVHASDVLSLTPDFTLTTLGSPYRELYTKNNWYELGNSISVPFLLGAECGALKFDGENPSIRRYIPVISDPHSYLYRLVEDKEALYEPLMD